MNPRFWRAVCTVVAVTWISCAEAPAGGRSIEEAGAESLPSEGDPINPDCVWPSPPETLLDAGGLVLKVWKLALGDLHSRPELPDDSGLLAYRAAVRDAGANVRLPPLFVPPELTRSETEIWRDEARNNERVYSGEVGSIELLTCLDALLFAEQNARVPQLEQSTEFLASALRRDSTRGEELVVVFGAGDAMFPPKLVYGLDTVDEYLTEGWDYWFVLHNHPLQRRGDTVALGVPAPSTVDVQFAQSLAEDRGLESVRVTNGFFTFSAAVGELSALRAR